jgi:hypothetical protein
MSRSTAYAFRICRLCMKRKKVSWDITKSLHSFCLRIVATAYKGVANRSYLYDSPSRLHKVYRSSFSNRRRFPSCIPIRRMLPLLCPKRLIKTSCTTVTNHRGASAARFGTSMHLCNHTFRTIGPPTISLAKLQDLTDKVEGPRMKKPHATASTSSQSHKHSIHARSDVPRLPDYRSGCTVLCNAYRGLETP